MPNGHNYKILSYYIECHDTEFHIIERTISPNARLPCITFPRSSHMTWSYGIRGNGVRGHGIRGNGVKSITNDYYAKCPLVETTL